MDRLSDEELQRYVDDQRYDPVDERVVMANELIAWRAAYKEAMKERFGECAWEEMCNMAPIEKVT